MKYFSDIDEKLNENNFEWHVNKVNEGLGLLKMFKRLLTSKSSLARSLFSITDDKEKEAVKKAIRDDKLKEINSGIEWWNRYFSTCHQDLAKKWIEINTPDGKDKDKKVKKELKNSKKGKYNSFKDSLIDDNEYFINEEEDNTIHTEVVDDKKNNDNPEDYFSDEKFEQYNEIKGMVKAIITGLCLMYDVAQEVGGSMGKQTMNYVKGVFDDMLKMKNLKDIEYLKDILKEYNLYKEKEKKEGDNAGDDEGKYQTLDELRNATKKNAEEVAKVDNVDAKLLGDFVSSIFSESLINYDIILNEASKGKLKADKNQLKTELDELKKKLDGSTVKFIEAYNKCDDETKGKIMIMISNMFGAMAQILKKTNLEPADLSDFITAVLKHKTKADPAELVKIVKN